MDLYSVSHNKKQEVEGQQAFAFSVTEHTKPGFTETVVQRCSVKRCS